jgi:hypothetical protein
MAPDFQNGDFALCCKIYPKFLLKIGHVILFNHPEFGVMIKKITYISIEDHLVRVTGNNMSTSSANIGDIFLKDIIGKVIWRIKK